MLRLEHAGQPGHVVEVADRASAQVYLSQGWTVKGTAPKAATKKPSGRRAKAAQQPEPPAEQE